MSVQSKKEEKAGYRSPYRLADRDDQFMDNFTGECIDTIDLFKSLYKKLEKHSVIAIDTETNSVDWGYGHVVGISLSTNPYDGYYIPIRHVEGQNIPHAEKVVKALFKLLKNKNLLMYNACFDMQMLEKEGWDFTDVKIFDVMNLVFLMDTNIHLPSLKDSAEKFLGRTSPHFEEVLAGRPNFAYVHPRKEGTYYASSDTANTFGLFKVLTPQIKKECPKILQLDNRFTKTLLQLCRTQMFVRASLLPSLEQFYADECKKYEKKVYEAVGYPFNIKSTKQLCEALTTLGIDTGFKTPAGKMSTKADHLNMIAWKYPFVKDITKFTSYKSIASGLVKYEGLHEIRCNYEMHNTPTGRLSSGDKKEKDKLPKGVRPYFDNVNAQNFPKPKTRPFNAVYVGEDYPHNLLGWRFVPDNPAEGELTPEQEKLMKKWEGYQIEAYNYIGNPRRLISVPYPEGHEDETSEWYYMRADYSGAELKLATLASKEPVLLKSFINGEDCHMNTAEAMFGERTKENRKHAKTCNFGLLYMGKGDTLARNSEGAITVEKGTELYEKYWETMKVLKRWINMEIVKAKKTCTCKTFLGRPRRLHYYFRHPQYFMRAFGERSVISHEIQGTLGDFIRLALIKAFNQIFLNPKYKDDVRFVVTIHDEIGLICKRHLVHEIADKLVEIMTLQFPTWEVPLIVEVELGTSYGFTTPIEKNKETGKWEFKMDKVEV